MGDISSLFGSAEERASTLISQGDYTGAEQMLMQSSLASQRANPSMPVNASTRQNMPHLQAINNYMVSRHATAATMNRISSEQTAAMQTQVAEQEAQVAEQQATLEANQQYYLDLNARAEALKQLQAQRTQGSYLASDESVAPSTKSLLGVG